MSLDPCLEASVFVADSKLDLAGQLLQSVLRRDTLDDTPEGVDEHHKRI